MFHRPIAYLIMLVLAIRPLINLFKSRETFASFFSIGSYSVTILSLWSMCMLMLMAFYLLSLVLGPGLPKLASPQILILIFLWYILMTGAIRAHASIISTVGYITIFFISVFIAPIFYRDISFDRLAKYVLYCAALLIIIHSTAWLWYSGPTSTQGLMNYSGVFDSKHIAASTFYINLPALIYLFLVRNNKFALILIIASVILIFLIFQRNNMLSLIVLMAVFSFLNKSLKPVWIFILLAGLIVSLVPKSALEHNIEFKATSEIEQVNRGNIAALGAGRMGVIIRGIQYWNNMTIFNKMFGLGAGGGNIISARQWRIDDSSHTHNQWIQTLLDYGLIGVFLLSAILFSLFRIAKKAALLDRRGMSCISFAFLCAVIVRTCTSNYFHGGASDLLIAFALGYPIYYLAGMHKRGQLN